MGSDPSRVHPLMNDRIAYWAGHLKLSPINALVLTGLANFRVVGNPSRTP
jgi:hypothetical protein